MSGGSWHVRFGRAWTLALLLALGLGLVVAASVATAGGSAPAPASSPTAPVTVTLITGDRVTVQPGGVATVEPGPGREQITFTQAGGGDRLEVLPSDAARLVADGRLDERLFDVRHLIEQGYDDAHAGRLPVLVQGRPEPVEGVVSGPGAAVTRELPRLRVAAVAQGRGRHAGRLWSRLTEPQATRSGARSQDSAVLTLAAGVRHVWLDEKLHVTLDQSVPMIGAPEAWKAGYRGDGVKVAVLDSGIDTTHPDLADRVVASQNFTTADSARDENGHGTHVASTIAGSGAASGGKYTGVAPGASLLNGRVCDASGSCALSWILAGMDWAAHSGADVVNMSLGGGPTDATDPLAQAVNSLSASTGTLFVIAAGNSGPDAMTVGTPGSADAALTVAAVDKSAHIASFSSRGPRLGDHALKPDIAAPGVSITAARGAGTSLGTPLNTFYTTLSGTSMATPHVAGAAALLAQRHPDWSGQRLKAALMSSARPLDGLGPYQAGTGLVDVPRAITQTVVADTPSLSFGLIPWPHEAPAQTKTVTYRNDGDSAITLQLALSVSDEHGAPAPDGLFRLAATQLTVPPHDTASVELTMTPQARQAGTYAGRITATGPDTIVQTSIGVTQETEQHTLTVHLLDRNGHPAADTTWMNQVWVVDYDTGELFFTGDGGSLRLPVGHYGVLGLISTPRRDLPDNRSGTLDDLAQMASPDVQLTKDITMTLDARQAHKVTVAVDRPTARTIALDLSAGFKVPVSFGYVHISLNTKFVFAALGPDVYVGSVGTSDKFVHMVNDALEQPIIRLDVNGPDGFGVDVWYGDNLQLPRTRLLGTHRMDVMLAGGGTSPDLAAVDARGKLVVLDSPPAEDATLLERVAELKRAGARAVLLDRSPLEAPSLAEGAVPAVPILLAADPQRGRLIERARHGRVSVTTHGVTASPYQYHLFLPTLEHMPERPVFRVRDGDLGAIDVRYPATAGRSRTYLQGAALLGRDWSSSSQYLRTTSEPLRRTELYSPAPVRWFRQTFDDSGAPSRVTDLPLFRAGSEAQETQYGAVIGPSFATQPLTPSYDAIPPRPAWAFRNGDMMDVRVPLLADAGPGYFYGYTLGNALTVASTRLSRDGQMVAENTALGRIAANVPHDEGRYRLEADAIPTKNPDGPEWELSTKVTAAWTFRSAATAAPTALPLMAVRFDPEVDDYNRAPGGRDFAFPVHVERQPGASPSPVTQLSVQASDDDGRSWQPARVVRAGHGWRAIVHNPDHGYVTLRASAADAQGNTVEQTIERAYGVD